MPPGQKTILRALYSKLILSTSFLSLLVGGGMFFLQAHLLKRSIKQEMQTFIGWQGESLTLDSFDRLPATFGSIIYTAEYDRQGKFVRALRRSEKPLPDGITLQAKQRVVSGDQSTIEIDLPWLLPQHILIPVQWRETLPQTDEANRYYWIIFARSAEFTRMQYQGIGASIAITLLIVILTSWVSSLFLRRLALPLSNLSMKLLEANLDTLVILGRSIAKRDSDSDGHHYRVTLYAAHFAQNLQLSAPQIRAVIKGAFLHDIGKIGIPDAILRKQDPLEQWEVEEMKKHVLLGMDMINHARWLRDAEAVVGYHHEKFDGSGYYKGLKGTEIPLVARIFTIANVFDALTSDRPFRPALRLEEALAILNEGAGTLFDPDLVKAFREIAPELFRFFAQNEEMAQQALAQILDRYFRDELIALMHESDVLSSAQKFY